MSGCAAALILAGCSGELSALDPAGPAAAQVADLWWVMFGGAMVILTAVMATILYALKRVRRGRGLDERRVLVGWGLVFPFLVLSALMAFAFARGERLLAQDDRQVLTIRGQAQQWFWTFHYPNGLSTTNALHVPAGTPFQVRLTSDDVIHSFWVPRLGGKMDAIPGKENVIALQADAPGRYPGICAEYCGVGHTHMLMEVQAHDPAAYVDALASAARRAPADPANDMLQERRSPASDAISNAADYILRWVGLR